ncbi:MAG: alpha-mannosidase [Candidatus Hydrogenedentes bacterium]|nr:alpha-mannosidase [Candidatus Hydrogenedentota bacterium]
MSASQQDIHFHLIGHGHIDPTWLWRWTEGVEEVRATFRSALQRMREFPDFHFTASSACFYAWIEETEPAMFKEIQQRVAEGRWEIAGGMWIEPDCNVPCGESFVRQGLYAQQYFQRAFGKAAVIGFNPDSFGHAGQLPQILRKLGMNHYVFMRPMALVERDYPDGTTFWWQAPDGSRVLTCNILESYNARLDDDLHDRLVRFSTSPHLNRNQRAVLAFFGVGNHGGGPTIAQIHTIHDFDAAKDLPAARCSTLEGYFADFEARMKPEDIGVIHTDLQHHARGCYSVHATAKALNRTVEHALMAAERMASVVWGLGHQDYPAEALTEAWKGLLYNQFHDILAGTSLESSYEDSADLFGAARHTAKRILNRAIQTLGREIDTTAIGNTVIVFNSLPWPVKQVVQVSPILIRELARPFRLVDETGVEVALQGVEGESITAETFAGKQWCFLAETPALGYRCYHLQPAAPALPEKDPELLATQTTLENRWWRVELDPCDGHLRRIFDKTHGVEVLREGAVLAAIVDGSDTWSHGVKEYRTEAGRFGNARMWVREQGPVLATVRCQSHFSRSEACLDLTLYADTPRIDLDYRINWQEEYRMLKVGFETRIAEGTATYATAYGATARPANGEENPGQHWLDLSGTVEGAPYGLTILNRGQYAFDVLRDTLRVTLLRSPAYAHHDPARFVGSKGTPIMDQGWHRIHLALLPHAGSWQEHATEREAWAFNCPLLPHVESAHPGTLPQRKSFLSCEGAEHVMLSVVKQSEDGTEMVLRGVECAGKPADVRIEVSALYAGFDVHFAPFEIKTLRIAPATGACRECNLLEEGI